MPNAEIKQKGAFFGGLHDLYGGETASTGILKLRLHTERFPVRS